MSIVLRFQIWFITTVYYKIRQMLLQNATAIFITKCDSFLTKCDGYYKMRRFYYKMRQFLQNATFITNCDSTVSNNSIVIRNESKAKPKHRKNGIVCCEFQSKYKWKKLKWTFRPWEYTVSSGNVQNRNTNKQTYRTIKRFCLLKRTRTCSWWNN